MIGWVGVIGYIDRVGWWVGGKIGWVDRVG